MVKHAPTPWEVLKVVSHRSSIYQVRTAHRIAMLEEIPEHENDANADFIVLACNAHDDLLAACKLAVAEREASSQPKLPNGRARKQWDKQFVLDSLLAAIKKAEGVSP